MILWLRALLFIAALVGTAISFLPFIDTETWWIRFSPIRASRSSRRCP